MIARAVLVLIAAVSCRSAETHYYTLVSPAVEAPGPADTSLQLDVDPVEVPADVDRAEMVVRTSAQEITPVQTRSWIAPLALEIRHAFSDDLARALGARDVTGATAPDGVPTFRIKLSVQRFESEIGKSALIEAISTIRDKSVTGPVLVCSHRVTEAAGPGYAALAEAHQRALEMIAQQVAAGVRSIQAGASNCGALPATARRAHTLAP